MTAFVWGLGMLENYIKYLKFLDEKLDKFFRIQKPYIVCHKGCSGCCKNSQFPYTALEMSYLLKGLLTLDKDTLDKITKNVDKILEKKKQFTGERFRYNCPLLIDDCCALYEYRGIVCRTFGLPVQAPDGALLIPFCCYEGLNYSNVFDIDKNEVSEEKVKELGSEFEPLGFNISYQYLTNPEFEKEFNIVFGERKPLIEWLTSKERV